jgi:hypothetical protein
MAQGTTRGVPIDTDPLLAADSDLLVASQKATKAYADTKQAALGFTPEDVANKSTSTSLGTSNTLYPSQNAVKSYVDTGLSTKQNSLGFTPENVANKQTALSANVAHYYNAPYINTLIESCNRAIVADYTDVVFTASQTAERVIRSIFIPKGTLIVGRSYKVRALVTKTGNTSTTTLRFRLGTSASPSPLSSVPVLSAVASIGATNNFIPFYRDYIHIQSNTTINNSGINNISDIVITPNGAVNTGFNFATTDYWLLLTCEHLSTSADTYTSHELILLL